MSFDLEMNTHGRINLAGLVLNYTVERNGNVVIPGGSHAGGIALVENLNRALTDAGLVVANGEKPAPTLTPAPAKATMTATPAPAEKPAKPKAPRKPAPVKAAPKEDEPQPGPAQPAVMRKRRGRPPKNPAAVA